MTECLVDMKGADVPDRDKASHVESSNRLDVEHEISSAGVGPWPQGREFWPEGEHFDTELLEKGDTRNVEDRYRYWTMDAIRADIAARALPFEVAIENLGHDFNIGSIVRTANALGARKVHIVGRRRWNRRGAMVTDRYMEVDHIEDAQTLAQYCAESHLTLVGVDNVDGAQALEDVTLPPCACLVFGEESGGLSADMIAACHMIVEITQRGSTRSMNVGHAAAITMWAQAKSSLEYQKATTGQ